MFNGNKTRLGSTMDWMSELPDFIIHHIYSSLSRKEAIQTSILSKAWLHAWSTYPKLVFDQSHFGIELALENPDLVKYPNLEENRDRFLKFVDNTMLRYCKEKIRIQHFWLFFTVVDCKSASFVNKWVGMAIKAGVQELDLTLNPYLTLLGTIFEAKSLINLSLRGCRLVLQHSIIIKLRSLRRLTLCVVYLNEGVVEKLISSCPLIENIVLRYCEGFEKIRVVTANLQTLKSFVIYTKQNQRVEINAPNLQSFSYQAPQGHLIPCVFNIHASRDLKYLNLNRVSADDVFFHSLVSQLPYLESLCLHHFVLLQRINLLLNCSLKDISLLDSRGSLVEVTIDARNLLSLYYSGHTVPLFCFTNTTAQMETRLALNCDNDDLDTQWFLQLRGFLTQVEQSKISVSISASGRLNVNSRELIPIQESPQVEKLSLNIYLSQLMYPSFVDGLFWSCHPKYVLLNWGIHISTRKFVKFLCQELMDDTRRNNSNCCNFHQIKCWRHYLNVVEIESFDGRTAKNWRPLHWQTLEDASPMTIRFTLKWG